MYVLSKNVKNTYFFPMKFSIFSNLCILHGQVFIMLGSGASKQLENVNVTKFCMAYCKR